MNKGLKTIADLERARARKRAVLDQLENAEMMRKSAQILLGCTLVRAKCKALTFDLDELDNFDPDRVTYVDMSKGYGKVIVYIKDTADEVPNLDFLTKRALKAVDAPEAEAEAKPDDPAEQLHELLLHISDEYYSAGWVDAIDNGTFYRYAFGPVSERPVCWQNDEQLVGWCAQMRELAEKSGVWWVLEEGEGEKTITLAEARSRWERS